MKAHPPGEGGEKRDSLAKLSHFHVPYAVMFSV